MTYVNHNISEVSFLSEKNVGSTNHKTSNVYIIHKVKILQRQVWMTYRTLKSNVIISIIQLETRTMLYSPFLNSSTVKILNIGTCMSKQTV